MGPKKRYRFNGTMGVPHLKSSAHHHPNPTHPNPNPQPHPHSNNWLLLHKFSPKLQYIHFIKYKNDVISPPPYMYIISLGQTGILTRAGMIMESPLKKNHFCDKSWSLHSLCCSITVTSISPMASQIDCLPGESTDDRWIPLTKSQ